MELKPLMAQALPERAGDALAWKARKEERCCHLKGELLACGDPQGTLKHLT